MPEQAFPLMAGNIFELKFQVSHANLTNAKFYNDYFATIKIKTQ